MITLSKIAKIANVSVSTASKAFSGSDEVNKETRDLVFRIAKDHGCFKKFYNAKYPKLVVAIIAPEFESAHYNCYLSCIQRSLETENCELCVSATDFSKEREATLLEYYYKHSNVDGILLINSQVTITEDYEVPVVLINPAPSANDSSHCSLVSSNMKPALLKSIDYLISKKVDSVGFIGEPLTIGKQRLFTQALAEKGLPYEESFFSISEDRFEAGGYAAMERLLSQSKIPRAVVCAYDNMALGAIRCVLDHGLSVPEDMAILGIDDIPQARFLNPPLASISTPTEKLCEIATQTMLRQINGETADPHQTALSEFHLRRSFEIL